MALVENVRQERFNHAKTRILTVAAGKTIATFQSGRTNPSISQPKAYITAPTHYRHNKAQQLYPPDARKKSHCALPFTAISRAGHILIPNRQEVAPKKRPAHGNENGCGRNDGSRASVVFSQALGMVTWVVCNRIGAERLGECGPILF
jgi:hypothetical protein